jgi:hypothetical protein
MRLENLDRRVLGSFRCVDAVSQAPVLETVTVRTEALDVRRNASAFYVIFDAPGMHALTTQFNVTSPWPAPATFEVALQPGSQRYLPRRAQLKMPRKLAAMSDPDSVMLAQDVVLYSAPAAPVLPNWAVLRIAVRKAGTDAGLPWAVLRVTRDSDGSVLATGMSDVRGEALLAVPGLGQSANQNGGGAVVATVIDTTVTAFFDPQNLNQPKDWLPDPDVVLQNLANPALKKATQAAKIGRGTMSSLTIPIAL